MGSRFPVLPAVALAVVVLLVVLWAFSPREEREVSVARSEPAATIPLLKDRALPTHRSLPGASNQPPRGGGDEAVAEVTPTPAPRMGSKRERFRERWKEHLRSLTPGAVSTEQDVDIESGLPEEGVGDNLPSFGQPRPSLPPDSPYEGLTDDERAELVVALQRLRDSGALRRVDPQDYRRVMEIMPDSLGLQDADRIFQEILGQSVGDWLAENRGPGEFYSFD